MRHHVFSHLAIFMGTCLTGLSIAAPTIPDAGAGVSRQAAVQLAPACVTNCFTKRWIYFYGGIAWGKKTANADFNKLSALIVNAAALGYNGIVVNIGGEDSYMAESHESTDLNENLVAIKQLALEKGIELIPMGGHPQIPAQMQPELAEAVPVVDTPFVVANGVARPVVHWLANDDFAAGKSDWDLWDLKIQHDPTEGHNGPGSLKLVQPNGFDPAIKDDEPKRHEQTRLHRRFVNLRPFTAYRASFWIMVKNYKAPLKVKVLDDTSTIPLYDSLYPLGWGSSNGVWNAAPNALGAYGEWKNITIDFNTRELGNIHFYVGAWSNAKNDEPGEAWIDDMQIREIGLAHPVVRNHLEVGVRSKTTGTVYKEVLDFTVANEALNILNGRIPNGSQLLVSWYQQAKNMMPVWTAPASACPPEYMAWQRTGYEKIKELYPSSKKFFINYDEWRIMNWDPSCQYASAGAYLAGTMTAMQAMLKEVNPGVELYVWNDMFDPYMNAIDKYFMVNGKLTGSAEGIHPDTVVVNWTQRDAYASIQPDIPLQQSSLQFFHNRNLKQMIALYYDDLPLTDEWLDNLDAAEADGVTGVDGFMYTTWVNDGQYEDLAAVANKIKARAKARWPQ
ncbi:hypothetical protein NC77_25935 [Janthinobacterium lividum]|uniref:hypothetical protein n=1 Tax=Janthinobacterium lividum TaxID=29581 RepID=UPI000539207D|nr:hypothetical protein [Janthinobacterium lividum]KHA75914.1 hypothetical protein NC77_25935 [Janthinobacterium lividum]